MYYVLTLLLTFLLLVFGFVVFKINKIIQFNNIQKKNRIIIRFLVLAIIVILVILFKINAIIVLIYFSFFTILVDLILYIIKRITKKEININKKVLLSTAITIVFLSYAFFLAKNVVMTKYSIQTKKNINSENFRIAQVTDSHIGSTMNGIDFIKYMKEINKHKPDIAVIVGDFVDDDTSYDDMIKGCEGLGQLQTKYGVYFVYGNHDKGYFNHKNFSNNMLENELKRNNVTILEDEVVNITENILLVGRQDFSVETRKSAHELAKDLDLSKYIIMLDHQPNDYKNEANSGVDLVLSGHTHGGQLFPLGQLGVLLNINDSYYGLKKKNNTNFIVSSGIGDWAMDFKTHAISEYVIIDIKNS